MSDTTTHIKNITVVGSGYVGLVSGACLADIGHMITCVDVDTEKVANLQAGKIPIFEPGLERLVKHNVEAGRLQFTTSLADALPNSDVVFIAVGTPSAADGRADLQYVYAVADEIGRNLDHYVVVVDKSTVPVGTATEVEARIRANYAGEFDVASCPEFLREGCAIDDFFAPDRIVIGVRNDKASDILSDVFEPVKGEKLITTVESAELIKYASNAFLATKISFINEIAQICERSGADIEEVAYGIGLDHRIGPKFLKAGIGWGGSCFPKDVVALDQMAGDSGYDFKLLKGVIEVNQEQRMHFIQKVRDTFSGSVSGKKFGVLGLAFKDNTDDIRESAAIDIIQQLLNDGAEIVAFDYQAKENAEKVLDGSIEYATQPQDVARDADAVLVVTEWPEFKHLDWKVMRESMNTPILFDGRNLLKPSTMQEQGFEYYSIGR